MLSQSEPSVKPRITLPEWYKELSRYEKPDVKKAVGQLANTLIPLIGLWGAMAWMLNTGLPYWTILPLMLIAAGLLVRVFIFFHDCGHESFLPSKRANRLVGYVCGVLTFTPFDDWRHEHALHHAGAGDLDRRGEGDVWTLTVEEYEASPWQRKLGYRLYRHPLVMFVLGPLYLFFIAQRFSHKAAGKRGQRSVLLANIGILAVAVAASLLMGWQTYLLIQLPLMTIAGGIGIWLFYVQHQYEEVYWSRHQEWDPVKAAMAGSSYYKLPKILQWFSGNIGLHHIHHLRPRIPNYNLQQCYDEVPAMQDVEELTLRESLKSLFLNLLDEKEQRMVSFRALKYRRPQMAHRS